MTTPAESSPQPDGAPFPLRVASTLCWVVGVVTALGGLAIGVPALQSPTPTLVPLIEGLVAGVAVVVAAILVRRSRRLGGILVIVACALPTLITLGVEGRFRSPPLLLILILALLTVLANWRLLH